MHGENLKLMWTYRN